MQRLTDEVYARPTLWKIFISSEMGSGSLRRERKAAAEAINDSGLAIPWRWEKDAQAGPYSCAKVCLGQARTSDGLVLILADRLTRMTRREYLEARSQHVPRYIMLKEKTNRDKAADRFVRREQNNRCVTGPFRNLSELKTRIIGALRHYAISSGREKTLRARRRDAQGRPVRDARPVSTQIMTFPKLRGRS